MVWAASSSRWQAEAAPAGSRSHRRIALETCSRARHGAPSFGSSRSRMRVASSSAGFGYSAWPPVAMGRLSSGTSGRETVAFRLVRVARMVRVPGPPSTRIRRIAVPRRSRRKGPRVQFRGRNGTAREDRIPKGSATRDPWRPPVVRGCWLASSLNSAGTRARAGLSWAITTARRTPAQT
jgi:hypothetical protein